MAGRIRWNQYGRNAVLEAKGEMSVRDIAPVLLKNEQKARKLLDEGWAHVLYGMKKYGTKGELAGVDFMLVPMNEEQFDFVARKCRNVLVYALHRR